MEPDSGATFRSEVRLVRVDAQVLQDGQPVKGLTQADFLVSDEGQPQQVQYFGAQSEPVAVLLLLDVSGSMKRSLEQMGRAALQALGALREDDKVSLVLFSRQSQVVDEFTTDRRAIQVGIQQAAQDPPDLGGGTLIHTALRDVARQLRQQPNDARRAIVILTDNESVEYRQPQALVIGDLYRADATLNAIVVGRGERPPKKDPNRAPPNPDFDYPNVYELAEQTGGEAIKADRVEQVFPELMERIRARYSLQYPAPEAKPGTFRQVSLQLTPEARLRFPRAIIRSRGGYYVRE